MNEEGQREALIDRSTQEYLIVAPGRLCQDTPLQGNKGGHFECTNRSDTGSSQNWPLGKAARSTSSAFNGNGKVPVNNPHG